LAPELTYLVHLLAALGENTVLVPVGVNCEYTFRYEPMRHWHSLRGVLKRGELQA
jgi:hypothetical protein